MTFCTGWRTYKHQLPRKRAGLGFLEPASGLGRSSKNMPRKYLTKTYQMIWICDFSGVRTVKSVAGPGILKSVPPSTKTLGHNCPASSRSPRPPPATGCLVSPALPLLHREQLLSLSRNNDPQSNYSIDAFPRSPFTFRWTLHILTQHRIYRIILRKEFPNFRDNSSSPFSPLYQHDSVPTSWR